MRNVHYTSILSRIYSLFLGFTLHVVHFIDLQKCTVTYIHPYSITWNSFNILKILCSTYLAIPSPLTPGNHWSFCSLHSFVSSRMSCSCNHIVCGPSDWLFLLSRMHLGFLHIFLFWTSLVVQKVKHLPIMQETWVQSPGRKDLLEKEMATHSSILAWKIPWTEDPGRLQSMGSQRVGHDWATSLHVFLWPDSSFHFSTGKQSMSGYTTVYLSIHHLKDMLVISRIWPFWVKLLQTSCADFHVDIHFSNLLGNYQRVWLLNHRSE